MNEQDTRIAFGFETFTYSKEQVSTLAHLYSLNGKKFSNTMSAVLDMNIFHRNQWLNVLRILEDIQSVDSGRDPVIGHPDLKQWILDALRPSPVAPASCIGLEAQAPGSEPISL